MEGVFRDGGAGRIRTADTQFRKLLLYPSELQPPLSDYYIFTALRLRVPSVLSDFSIESLRRQPLTFFYSSCLLSCETA